MNEVKEKKGNIFSYLKDKNDKFWARFYGEKTKFVRAGKWYSIAPAVIILIGAVLIVMQSFGFSNVGFNLGLDFTGGSIVESEGFSTTADVDFVKGNVSNYLDTKGLKYEMRTPKLDNGDFGFTVTFQSKGSDDDIKTITAEVERLVNERGLVTDSTTVSASASGERIMITFISIAATLFAIMLYMLFRFKFTSGIAALVGLLHDVLVASALCALFRIQINYQFVAAMITIVVYSLNNTIVQFDRVRAKEKQLRTAGTKMPCEYVVDSCVKETFARTMGTTVTTIVPVFVLCFIGIPAITEFALPILFGLVAGTFSTLYITTSLYVRFENYNAKRKLLRAAGKTENNAVKAQV
jgi:preprotein translocase SecF subunit